ncbi:TPA: class I SAM-dependent methyltransferase [Legionella pneumophila]|uniref:class I SAM-dependent methyltransferase n=1 Tax=Legionella pneumophila TaxID=446 RepID=UPI0005B36F5C|nr:class I SAM-dependent methyltransferase [Legionella pneumophila]TIG73103.1 class I SAM-dependent methyltransferase [Legionella pneumophila]HAT6979780.1 methyltransferase domain-containing protein [Legionella pneumophila]HAT8803712.1 methyltransferase domain-containing protein [Legionella pneumophila]HAU1991149.1 class I SAM-dependent methyltransferase [Legionella pneumophila]HAU2198087.1 class I SAM-dependent methyltransferase [Legionella pneumophila]
MIKFSNEQVRKYGQSIISGTGFLAFRDLEQFARNYNTNLDYALDLGCGSGRSTKFLSAFCKKINGCDIDKNALHNAKKSSAKDDSLYFENSFERNSFLYGKYTSIFSILMFFHLSTKDEIKAELVRCYNSLENLGNLIIVSGTKNLYMRNYLTVKGVGKAPVADGDIVNIKLLTIDCEITDYYWSENCIIDIAETVGFKHLGTHLPLGYKKDQIDYIDEVNFAPYYYLALRKNA